MAKKKSKKKGFLTLAQLPMAVIVFGVAVIVVGVIATVLEKIATTQTSGGAAANATAYGLQGINTLAQFFNPIGVIIAAVIIIGLIMGAFMMTRGRSEGGV